MGLIISDGEGGGTSAGVNKENQLLVLAVDHTQRHHLSRVFGDAYQIIGEFAAVNNATHTVLHVINNTTAKFFVVDSIRVQTAGLTGGTAPPDPATFFEVGFGRTVASGGSIVTPVNLNRSSGQAADITVVDNNPTMAGTFIASDKWYVSGDGQEHFYDKEEAIIVGIGKTMEIRVTTDNTAGSVYAKIGFLMVTPN